MTACRQKPLWARAWFSEQVAPVGHGAQRAGTALVFIQKPGEGKGRLLQCSELAWGG